MTTKGVHHRNGFSNTMENDLVKERKQILKRELNSRKQRDLGKVGTEKQESIRTDTAETKSLARTEKNITKPQLAQQLESNDRPESNVEKSNKAKEYDCLSLYADRLSDIAIQEIFNEIFSMPRSNENTSLSHVRKPATTPSTPVLISTSVSTSTSSSSFYSSTSKDLSSTVPWYLPTPKMEDKLKKINESQKKRIISILNVGRGGGEQNCSRC